LFHKILILESSYKSQSYQEFLTSSCLTKPKREEKMKKESILLALMTLSLLFCSLPPIAVTSGPTQPPVATDTLYVGRDGWGPCYADPVRAHDERSQELIFNVYDTLIMFGAPVTNAWGTWDVHEQYYAFSPSLATNVPTRQDITMTVTNTSAVGADPTGTTWTNGSNTYTLTGWVDELSDGFNAGDPIYLRVGVTNEERTWTVDSKTGTTTITLNLWRGSYVFNIRTSPPIYFYNETGDAVDTFDVDDVAYSFHRALVQDQAGSPVWMYGKALFDQPDHAFWDNTTAMDLAHLINNAFETNGNDFIINVGVRFPDHAFKQCLANTWGSICSEEFSVSIGCWDGDLYDTAKYGGPFPDWWIDWNGVAASPYDTNWRYCGTGPYHVATVDPVGLKVVLQRNPGYWRGWPVADRKAYLEYVDIEYVADWPTRRNEFLDCQLDVCDVPRANMFELLGQNGNPIIPQIETIKNINPALSLDMVMFTFTVNSTSPYIGSGHFPYGIHADFFNNTHVRKAFAYAFNQTQYIYDAWHGEASNRGNPFVLGLYPDYYNASYNIPSQGGIGYDINYRAAYNCLTNATFTEGFTTKSVWKWGFSLTMTYNTGNDQREIACQMVSNFFATLQTMYGAEAQGPAGNFIINIADVSVDTYLRQLEAQELPIFCIGLSADFADADDFARACMYSGGRYSQFQNYTAVNGWGTEKDTLIDQALLTDDTYPAGKAARQALYNRCQQIYYNDCPSFPVVTPYGRRWCKSWVRGWYYNALYPSDYYYGLYKEDTPWDDVTGPKTGIPDGIVNIMDYFYVLDHFNAKAPVPGMANDPKWTPGTYGCGGCDVYGDRIVNNRDVISVVLGGHFFEGFPQEQEHGGTVDLVAETSNQKVAINKTVTVAVKVKNVTGFTAYEICLLYDGSLLELVSWGTEPITGWQSNMTFTTQKVFGGESCVLVDCGWDKLMGSGSTFSGNATLATFVFKGIAEGNATLGISRSTLAAGDPMHGILYNPINGTVSVPAHDIAIDSVVSPKSVIGKGYCANMTVALTNLGTFTETFNVTVYANTTIIANLTDITLSSGNSTTEVFPWNTTDFAYDDYAIWAYAWPVPGETDTADNNCTCGFPVHVGVPGDVSGTTPGAYDGITNMKDIAYLVSLFQTKPTKPPWYPNADVNNDGVVDMKDIAIAVYYFNQHE